MEARGVGWFGHRRVAFSPKEAVALAWLRQLVLQSLILKTLRFELPIMDCSGETGNHCRKLSKKPERGISGRKSVFFTFPPGILGIFGP